MLSTDDAQNWRLVSDGILAGADFNSVSDYEIHPTLSSVLYATVGGRFIKSTDGGRTWRRMALSEPETVVAVEVDPHDGEHVFLIGQKYLHESRDGGATFVVSEHGLSYEVSHGFYEYPRDLYIDPGDPQVLYTLLGSSLYKTADAGGKWIQLQPPTTTLVTDPKDTRTIYSVSDQIRVSRDQGATWSTLSGPFGAGQGIGVHPRLAAFLIVSGSKGVFRSTDGGRTWRKASVASSFLTGLSAELHALPQHPGTLFQVDGRVFRSTNDGKSWRAVEELPYTTEFDAFRADPATLIAAGIGFSVSTDSGSTWRAGSDIRVESMALDPQGGSTISIVGEDQQGNSGYARSTDFGATWKFQNAGLEDESPETVSVNPRNRSQFYLFASKWRLFKSSDAGMTWKLREEMDCCFGLDMDIVISRARPSVIFAGSLYRSTNGGATFLRDGPSLTRDVRSITEDPTHPGTFYAAGGAIWVTTDYGGHWSLFDMKGSPAEFIRQVAINPWVDGLFAGGQAYTFHTVPGAPIIRQVFPGYARAGTPVTVIGSGFSAARGVIRVNGIEAQDILSWSGKRVQFRIPTLATTGNLTISARGLRSNAWEFPVLPSPGHVLPESGTAAGGTRIQFVLNSSPMAILAGAQAVRYVILREVETNIVLVSCSMPPGKGTVPVTAYVFSGPAGRFVSMKVGTFTYR